MLAKVKSQAVIGLSAHYIDVEVHMGGGRPVFSIVGLPDTVVRESRDRVKAAIKSSGFEFPARNIVVNLAPASVKKIGTSFDFPIALGLLVAFGMLRQEEVSGKSFCGELSLDGHLRPIAGVLPMASALAQNGIKELVLPVDNASEAGNISGIYIYAIKNLREAYLFLKKQVEIAPFASDIKNNWYAADSGAEDFSEVKGQNQLKRGLEVAAAGSHNALIIGPPGAGKTMLARRLPKILPAFSYEEALQTTKIYSVAGLLRNDASIIAKRPFRAPHHSISYAALVGGGTYAKPGEISLAHNGVLFLDELPQFRKDVLDMMRQPMEDGFVTISRVQSSYTYPAQYMLVAAMNPCPCGRFGDSSSECTCSPQQIQKYISKISGPFLDRIDMHLKAPSLKYSEIVSRRPAEKSYDIKKRVCMARSAQEARYKALPVKCNAYLPPAEVEKYCVLDRDAEKTLEGFMRQARLSARAYHRVLKVARTIADLAGCETIETSHICEAIQYRALDINYRI